MLPSACWRALPFLGPAAVCWRPRPAARRRPAPAGRHRPARRRRSNRPPRPETPTRCARWRAPTVRAAPLSEFVQSLTFPKADAAPRSRSAIARRSSRWRASACCSKPSPSAERRRARHVLARSTSSRAAAARPVDDRARRAADGRQRPLPARARCRDRVRRQEPRRSRAPDLTLTLPAGPAFVSKTPDGPTAVVLLGRGRVEFAPKPEAERGQVRIFSGAEALDDGFRRRVRPRARRPSSTRGSRPTR